jgi:hypothetical protein
MTPAGKLDRLALTEMHLSRDAPPAKGGKAPADGVVGKLRVLWGQLVGRGWLKGD